MAVDNHLLGIHRDQQSGRQASPATPLDVASQLSGQEIRRAHGQRAHPEDEQPWKPGAGTKDPEQRGQQVVEDRPDVRVVVGERQRVVADDPQGDERLVTLVREDRDGPEGWPADERRAGHEACSRGKIGQGPAARDRCSEALEGRGRTSARARRLAARSGEREAHGAKR